jgi:F420-non-reducing hydrogenase iron-sulfur subunit
VELAQRLLKMTGLEPERMRLDWISASEGEKFAHVVQEFVTKLKELGPTPVKKDEKLVTRLQAAIDASRYFRLKVLTGKEINLTTKGNVYAETLKVESLEEIMAQAAEDEYRNSLILQLTHSKPYSVKVLAKEIGEPTDKTLEHVVSLRAKNMLALDHIEGSTPKYKAILIGGA